MNRFSITHEWLTSGSRTMVSFRLCYHIVLRPISQHSCTLPCIVCDDRRVTTPPPLPPSKSQKVVVLHLTVLSGVSVLLLLTP